MINEENVGYLPAIILRELKAGRPCEVTGGAVASIKTMDDYEQRKYRLIDLFGEIIQWRSVRTALIATRKMPKWAAEFVHAHINEAPEMERWKTD